MNLSASIEDMDLIHKITVRAARHYEAAGNPRDMLGITMDLTATHANGCPLDLAGLLAADPLNFLHDVSGIARRIDRNTGQLRDCFTPRFAVQVPA